MQIERVELRGFRNLAEATVELSAGVIRVVGSNGQGKTNLFEAIHLLSQGWSFRTRRAADWIRWGESSLLLRAEGTNGGEPRKSALSLEENGSARRIRLDGKEGGGMGLLLGSWSLVAVGPSDISLVQGEPELRRIWMDALISQYSPQGRESLRRYRHILRQRNAYLRGMVGYDPDLKVVLDESLIEEGGEVVRLRRELIDRISDSVMEHYHRISGGVESCHLQYRCSWGEGGAEVYRERLSSLFHRESELKTTVVGPHRDDLLLSLNDNEFRSSGSQGQQRSMALALQLAAAGDLERRFGEPPILLLDDIFCELDTHRRMAVGELLERSSQVLLAAPEASSIPFAAQQTLQLDAGVIRESIDG